ncbi:MAG: hypothetical protein AB4911_13635 [Oscillochloridaceae bacterium umkhey_bin13]
MAGRTTTLMDRGQIMGDAGADTFRGELLSAHAVRCADLWLAQATVYSDGAAEIEIRCGLDSTGRRWEAEVYYYSFERAVRALREYEETGNLPEGE